MVCLLLGKTWVVSICTSHWQFLQTIGRLQLKQLPHFSGILDYILYTMMLLLCCFRLSPNNGLGSLIHTSDFIKRLQMKKDIQLFKNKMPCLFEIHFSTDAFFIATFSESRKILIEFYPKIYLSLRRDNKIQRMCIILQSHKLYTMPLSAKIYHCRQVILYYISRSSPRAQFLIYFSNKENISITRVLFSSRLYLEPVLKQQPKIATDLRKIGERMGCVGGHRQCCVYTFNIRYSFIFEL